MKTSGIEEIFLLRFPDKLKSSSDILSLVKVYHNFDNHLNQSCYEKLYVLLTFWRTAAQIPITINIIT